MSDELYTAREKLEAAGHAESRAFVRMILDDAQVYAAVAQAAALERIATALEQIASTVDADGNAVRVLTLR